VLAIASLALIASSGGYPEDTSHRIGQNTPVTTELTPELTTRVYRIQFETKEWGNVSTVENATATVSGSINAAGIIQGTPPQVAYAVYELDGSGQRAPRSRARTLARS
jgi:hypothetical protein